MAKSITPEFLSRLCSSMHRSRQALRSYRENFADMVRQSVGPYYSEESAKEAECPVNLIGLYEDIVGRQLIAKNPRMMLSTFKKQYKSLVRAMQFWVNSAIEKMCLAETLRRAVTASLYSFGVVKVGLASPADAAMAAWKMQAGMPYAWPVSLDDFVWEMNARSPEEVGYIGHRIRVPLDAIQSDQRYSKARKNLAADSNRSFNVEGDERLSMLGRSYYGVSADDWEDHIDLWEVYIPRYRKVLTLAGGDVSEAHASDRGDGEQEALLEQEYLGPDEGPYHILGLKIVPDNLCPKGPIQDLFYLHKSANNIYRKAIRQARDQKQLLPIPGANVEDANRAMETSDGGAFKCDHEPPKPIDYRGPNQQNLQFGVHLWDTFDKHAGNMSMMGGLAPQSKTLGQDKMLAESASAAILDKQDRVVSFTASVCKGLLWYWYHHPTQVMRAAEPTGVPGLDIQHEIHPVGAPSDVMQRNAPWEDLDIKIDPYSIQHSTPQGQLQFLNAVVDKAMPMMPLLMQQGVAFDAGAWVQMNAEYGNLPDLINLFTVQEPPAAAMEGAGEPAGPGMPAQTERTYTRRSLGGDTPQNREQTMLQGFSGNGQQNKNGQGP